MTEEEYYTFIQPYEDAKEVLLARLNVLKHNLYEDLAGQPIHNIQSRIKKKKSLEDKLRKKEKEPTVMNATVGLGIPAEPLFRSRQLPRIICRILLGYG